MRTTIIRADAPAAAVPADEWLDLDRLARVEVTSEDPGHPVEAALVPGRRPGWRAAGPGPQTIRLRSDEPRRVRRVWLHFAEPAAARTREFVVRWASGPGRPVHEVVRQMWTFSPGGATHETEDYRGDLWQVTALELTITPDIAGGDARASLAEMRLA